MQHRSIAVSLLAAALAAACSPGPERPSGSGLPAPTEGVEGEPTSIETLDRADELADALVGLRVRALLLEELKHEALELQIGVEGGRVVLSGTVSQAWSRSRASALAISVEGVEQVASLVQVAAAQGPRESEDDGGLGGRSLAGTHDERSDELSDAVLRTRVKLRLAEELGEDVLDLTVEVRAGVVRLGGVVHRPEERERALRTARAVEGVREVRDRLELTRRGALSDRSRRAAGRDRSA